MQRLRNVAKPVLTKRDFVRRYQRGEFGNRAPTWGTLAEFQASGYVGLIHIRNRVTGGPTWYNIAPSEVTDLWKKLVWSGTDPSSLYLSGMAPTPFTILQGEVRRSVRHIDLRYTRVAKPMRDALAEEEHHADGLAAISLLKQNLCSNSYTWLIYLLDAYLDHVVEFSTYAINWGTLPHYNTVFWEVRKY